MNLTFTFEAVALGEAMERMGEQLGIAGPKIVKVEAAALLKQVIRETSPDNRKQGKDAVRMDLYRAVTPLDPARFTSPKIAEAIRQRDLPALNAIMQKAHGKWRQWEVVAFDPDSQHKAMRNRRGHVPRFKRKFTADTRFWKGYLKQEQARVGIAKSSWAMGYQEVGGHLPDWIVGHSQAGISTVISYLNDKEKPSITVISRALGVTSDEELGRSIRRAMSIRTVAMQRKTRRMLADPLKYVNLFAQYQ